MNQPPLHDFARAICSDYPEDWDAMSKDAQAYWLRLAFRGLTYLSARSVELQPANPDQPSDREAA